MRQAVVLLALAALPLLAGGCGDESDGRPGGCTEADGIYHVQVHCLPDLLYRQVTISQFECELSVDFGGAAPLTGTVDEEDGSIILQGDWGDGTPVTCTGVRAGGSVVLTCEPGACQVILS